MDVRRMPCSARLIASLTLHTAISIWLNDGVYEQCKKLHISAYSGHTSFDNFLAERFLYNMLKPRGDVQISSSFYVLLLS